MILPRLRFQPLPFASYLADPNDPMIIRLKERIAKKTYIGDTALHYLVGRDPKYNTPELIELVKLMFLKNASLNSKNRLGATPLHRACAAGNVDMARELIRWAADVNETTDMGLTCLHMACYAGHTEVVRLLLENNCAKYITYKCKYGIAPCDYVLKDEIYQLLRNARLQTHRAASAAATEAAIASATAATAAAASPVVATPAPAVASGPESDQKQE